MNFHVKPNDLDSFGDQLKNLAKQTDAANHYLAKNASVTSKEAGIGGKFIWAEAITTLEDAVGAINTNLDKLKSLSNSSGDEVHDSASMNLIQNRSSCCCRGWFHAVVCPGRAGQSPPRVSSA